MRLILAIVFFVLTLHTVHGQSVSSKPQLQTKQDLQTKEESQIQAKSQILTLGRSNHIFPKTQINSTGNPTFERSAFSIDGSFKGNMQQFKSTESYGGVNSQFSRRSSKQIKETDIPKEFYELLNKKPINDYKN